MSYAPLTFAEILASILADWRNRENGIDTSKASEVYIRSAVVAGALWGAHAGLERVEDQIFPDTADSDNLVRWATTYGLERKAAAAATDGEIAITGVNGTVIAIGALTLAHDDGTTYTNTAGGTIAAGNLEMAASCNQVGIVGNKSEGTDVLTVQSPPAGVDADANITAQFTNGTDEETDTALLVRLLNRIRLGNAGGTANDYEQWALSVSAVAFAYALPLRRGAGTADVAVFAADVDGNRDTASSAIRTAALDYINTVRPVTADVQVPATTNVPVNVTVTLTVLDDGVVAADVEDAVVAAIEDAIRAVEPGDSLYLTRLMRAISAVDGVIDFTIVTPVANTPSTVSSSVVQVLTVGTITVT